MFRAYLWPIIRRYTVYIQQLVCVVLFSWLCWQGRDRTVGFYYIDISRVYQCGVCCCWWPTCRIVAIVMPISFVVSLNSVGIFGTLVVTKLKHSRSALLSHVDCIWNVMALAQKPDFVFQRNGRVHLNRRGRQFSWLPAAEASASAVVILDTPCSKVVWRVLATHSIRQFPLHFLLPVHYHVPWRFNWTLNSSWMCDIPVCVCVGVDEMFYFSTP